jgi:hypothetical protein
MNPRFQLSFLCLLFFALLLPGLALATDAPTDTPTDAGADVRTVLDHYETVRLALTQDTVDGTEEARRGLATSMDVLIADFDAEAAGVTPDSEATARELLGEAKTAAEQLATADGLEAIRAAFYELTKPLVRYRELMVGEKPVVAYCPMARKSWLQPDEEIGNPYHGQSMPTCGSVVSTR